MNFSQDMHSFCAAHSTVHEWHCLHQPTTHAAIEIHGCIWLCARPLPIEMSIKSIHKIEMKNHGSTRKSH